MNKIKSKMSGKKSSDETNDNNDETKKKKQNIKIGTASYIKTIIVLILVIAAIYIIYIIMKKFLGIKGKVGQGAEILISQSLGPGKWVQVVNVGGKFLILGITNDRINLLSEVTDEREIERYQLMLNEKKIDQGNQFIDIVMDFFQNKIRNKPENKKFDYEIDSVDFIKQQKDRVKKMNGEE